MNSGYVLVLQFVNRMLNRKPDFDMIHSGRDVLKQQCRIVFCFAWCIFSKLQAMTCMKCTEKRMALFCELKPLSPLLFLVAKKIMSAQKSVATLG